MIIKTTKIIGLSFVVFTLLLNLMNLFSVKNYEYIAYKEITTWLFIAITISLAIIIIEFVLVKSKIILYTPKDWKRLGSLIFTVFLSVFVFVFTFWITADNSYIK
ncbi:MAG: hypothetical protein U9P70_01230 [Patescibacteria group bacterium]|nr:hypothetical protein [Patescibacteria group bacterium]